MTGGGIPFAPPPPPPPPPPPHPPPPPGGGPSHSAPNGAALQVNAGIPILQGDVSLGLAISP